MGYESHRDNLRGIFVYRMMELVCEHGLATTEPVDKPGCIHLIIVGTG